jgi:hypothetical protein
MLRVGGPIFGLSFRGDLSMLATVDELAQARMLLEQMNSGGLSMRRGGRDITQAEIGYLRLEIVFLEKCLHRLAPTRQS